MEKDLFEECERCLQDEPAASTAWCPLHVDLAQFNGELKKGNFKKAYKVLEKRVPLAGIIGMICDHPCEQACVRGKLDRAVNVSELERAAVSYGYTPFKQIAAAPQSKANVAVIGGGLSGISAAFELRKKGFQVTIFEKSLRLGGQIWRYEGRLIEKARIEEELKVIAQLGVEVRYNHAVREAELKKIAAEYSAVYLGTGTWETDLPLDPETLQVSGLPIFAGGRLWTHNDSVIYAVSSAKKAVVSIERYIKKISMTASREKEGSFETPMRYNLDGVKPAPQVVKSGEIYTREEAISEADRCLQCRCAECIKACSHLRRFNVTAKSYGRQIQINENVIMGTRYANKMINSCTLCGLCREQCPVGIGMRELIHQTRESMVEQGKMPVSAHDFALKDMEFSNSSRFFLVKSPPSIPGEEKADYLFYPGCQLSASYPDYVEKAYLYLVSTIKEGVGLMLGCCGAPARWAGRQDLLESNLARFNEAWNRLGNPTFILACSSCCEIFAQYLPNIRYLSLWEIIDRYGLPETTPNGNGHGLNIHDACSTRHNQNIHQSVRSIAGKLGYQIQELKYAKEKTKCCGYGGLVYFANREQANDFVKDRIGESSEDLLVYCAMCKDLFVDAGKRTLHILDLIFAEDMEAAALQRMPNLSQRHANRAELKKRMLQEFWHQAAEGAAPEMDQLIISDDVWKIMDDRYILRADVEQVVRHARESGERFFNPDEGSYLANLRIENVTYWVRYAEEGETIRIISVYSHRMEVERE